MSDAAGTPDGAELTIANEGQRQALKGFISRD